MLRPFLDGAGVLVDNVGTPVANGSIEFYVSPGSTPADVYDGPTLTTSLGHIVDLDATGAPEAVIWLDPEVTYKCVIKSAPPAGATVKTIDPVAASEPGLVAQGFRNRLINGGFAINQRASASNADDTYCFDRWYVLTQSSAIAPSALTDPESGAPTGARLTQSNATAQRMGLAQIIESLNCRDLRSTIATLAGRVRLSTAADVRYAVLEWTGTANVVTSDVVNDWDSGSYTAGNFFIGTVNVLAVGEVACAAATWRALDAINATAGSGMNNIIVMVWTEAKVAQNVTLDLTKLQVEAGAVATAYEWLPTSAELQLCQRYMRRIAGPCGLMAGHVRTSTIMTGAVHHPVAMRTAPAIATNTSTGVAYCSVEEGGSDWGSIALVLSGGANSGVTQTMINATQGAATMTVGRGACCRLETTGYIDFISEL